MVRASDVMNLGIVLTSHAQNSRFPICWSHKEMSLWVVSEFHKQNYHICKHLLMMTTGPERWSDEMSFVGGYEHGDQMPSHLLLDFNEGTRQSTLRLWQTGRKIQSVWSRLGRINKKGLGGLTKKNRYVIYFFFTPSSFRKKKNKKLCAPLKLLVCCVRCRRGSSLNWFSKRLVLVPQMMPMSFIAYCLFGFYVSICAPDSILHAGNVWERLYSW